ncbi:MAG: pyruvate dehydrogenase (acetyl-transferring) E1 component subunit alpha [Alphaproteobacteria bacterium]
MTKNIANDQRFEQLKQDFYQMLLIRRFEERAGQLYGLGLIGGFCHLYIGQEAVVVGLQTVMKKNDCVITSYRDHGHMLASGMKPSGVMAELTGRSAGYSRGKGGSMHMFSRKKNFYGGHGIVGAQVPLGAGLALALQYRYENGIGDKKEKLGLSFIYMGEGALNQGQVYETFNMAALWKLPAIFVIENNRYAMGTSAKRSSANDSRLCDRGIAYGIKGSQVDGMDVEAMRNLGKEAIQYVESGNGPFIIEAQTYRYRGHSMSDPAKYRSREEVDEIRAKHDPIEHIKKILKDNEQLDEKTEKDTEQKIKTIILEAVKIAEDSPEPNETDLWTDILQ